jgi:hypothetical protein
MDLLEPTSIRLRRINTRWQSFTHSAPCKIQVINMDVMLSRKALPCRVKAQWLLVISI